MLSPDSPNNIGGKPVPANILLDVGKPLFAFTVRDLSGRPVYSSELKGKIAVVNWWFTSCGACVLEMPGFNQLVQKYESRIKFLAVAIDSSDRVRAFLATHPFNFRQTISSDSIYRFIGGGAPHTVLVDKQGIVAFERKGGGSDVYKELEQAIEVLLAKKDH
jgi:thiol-disulfide isomerase/thioredoxin